MSIKDSLKALFKISKASSKKPFGEIGVSGNKMSVGRSDDEFLTELKGDKATKVYKEMSKNDATVAAVLFSIKMLIRQITWDVQPYDEDTQSIDDATFLKECQNDMSHTWGDFIAEVMSMAEYGYSYFETIYKRRLGRDQKDGSKRSNFNDNKIGWRKHAIRSQDTLYKWDIDDDGGLQAFVQQDPNSYAYYNIPIEKSLLFRMSTYKNSPEGESILRRAYRAWYFKKHIEEIEAIGCERDLAGIPIIKCPSSIMGANAGSSESALYDSLKDIIEDIKNDENAGAIIPSDTDEKGNPLFDLTLLSTAGSRLFNTNEIINRKKQEIATSVLADFILLGHEKVGSFALSSSKTEIFATALGAYADGIAAVLNQYAVPRLFEINGMKRDRYPEFKHGDIESVDLQSLAAAISSLSMAGMPLFPDENLENYLRKIAGLPETTAMAE